VLSEHLKTNWAWRNFDHVNDRLHRLLWIAQEADRRDLSGLLEDSARALFEREVQWERFAQRQRSRVWLTSLAGNGAETVARALRSVPGATKWYLDGGWRPLGAHTSLRSLLG
jgi:hypothetical protein